MADGQPIGLSQTNTESWHDLHAGTRTILFLPPDSLKPPDQSFREPTQLAREGVDLVASPFPTSEPNRSSYEPPSKLNLLQLDARNQDYELYSTKNDSSAMVGSPRGSLREPSNPTSSPRTRPKGVTYAPSASSPDPNRKPLRQDSAYESARGTHDELSSDGSEVGVQQQQRRLRAREQIVVLRRKVLKTRQAKKQRQDELRRLREKVRGILDKLTQKINEVVALNRIQEEIGPYYEEFRAAQDVLGPAEHEYDRLESRLDNEEEDLEEAEEQYYQLHQYNVFETSDRSSRFEETISPSIKPCNPPDSDLENLALDDNLFEDYLSKIDEALALKKELQNLEDDYFRVSEDANRRRQNGFPVFATMASFLAEYPKSRADILESLYRTEDAIFDLREECLKQGVFTTTEYLYEPRDALYDELMEAVDEALERSPLRVAAQRVKYPEHTKDFGNKRDYVNKWLLQCVQNSTVGMMMLRTWIYLESPGMSKTPYKTLVEFGDDKWSDLALETWDNDGAGDKANQNYNASRLDAIAGDTARLNNTSTRWSALTDSLRSLQVVLDYNRSVGQPITGSEEASYAMQTNDLDTTPTKMKPGADDRTPTKLDIDDIPIQPSQHSEPTSPLTAPTAPSALTSQSIHLRRPTPHIVYNLDTLPSLHHPPQFSPPQSPQTSIGVSRRQSLRSNSTSKTSWVPSLRSARTSIDARDPCSTQPLLSSSSGLEAPRPLLSRSSSLKTQKPLFSPSSTLTAPEPPSHHRSRRKSDVASSRLTICPTIHRSASFQNV